MGSNALSESVAALRQPLGTDVDAGKANLFDLQRAHELFAAPLGQVASSLATKRHLIIVPSGPLTNLPFQLLVTEKPAITRCVQALHSQPILDAIPQYSRKADPLIPNEGDDRNGSRSWVKSPGKAQDAHARVGRHSRDPALLTIARP
jgi:hypothetical protein